MIGSKEIKRNSNKTLIFIKDINGIKCWNFLSWTTMSMCHSMMYSVQSNWFVYDKKLKDEIIISVGNTLLPVYGIFIGRFRDCLGIHANQYIRYGMFEIQDRINNLFLIKKTVSRIIRM